MSTRLAIRTAVIVAAATLATAHRVAAQTPTVILQIEQETTERNVQMEEAAMWAAANGIDTPMLSTIFGQLTSAVGMGLAGVPGDLSALLPADLMTKLDIGGEFAAFKIGSELRKARTPEHTTSSSTIFIRPDLFVMKSGGQALVWVPAGGTGPAAMYAGNPDTGAYAPVDLQYINTFVGGAAQHTGIEPTPVAGGTRTIAGHSARGYEYSYELDLAMGGFPGVSAPTEGTGVGALNVVSGEAWVAGDLPEAAQVAAFFRDFADSFDGGMLGGQVGVMADLAELGIPLETNETLRTYLTSQIPGTEERQLLMESVSTSTVTDISTASLTDEELFGPGGMPTAGTATAGAGIPAGASGAAGAAGAPGGAAVFVKEGCDCSCEAFEELQEISELPEEEQKGHPKAMALAMCAPECGMKWAMTCGK